MLTEKIPRGDNFKDIEQSTTIEGLAKNNIRHLYGKEKLNP